MLFLTCYIIFLLSYNFSIIKALYIYENVTAHSESGINFTTNFVSVRYSQAQTNHLIEVLHEYSLTEHRLTAVIPPYISSERVKERESAFAHNHIQINPN